MSRLKVLTAIAVLFVVGFVWAWVGSRGHDSGPTHDQICAVAAVRAATGEGSYVPSDCQ